MKVKIQGARRISITGEYIKLDALLKYASIVSTGGEAKQRIQNREVYVGKDVCTVRGKKIRPGEVVSCGDNIILVKQAKV
jgi:ribosome-associated protein